MRRRRIMHVYENKSRPLDISFLEIVRLIAASCKYVFLFKEIQIISPLDSLDRIILLIRCM